MKARLPAPRLLLVTNRKTAKMPLPELATRALFGGVDVVQIREKDLNESDLLALCTLVLDSVGDNSKLMVNGSPEVARQLGIGLHLPESHAFGVPTKPSEFVRCSRAFHAESSEDVAPGFDFGIIGHVFETGGKAGRPPLGLERLKSIAKSIPIPVLAIGGMTPDRVSAVIGSGVHGIAVFSAINESVEPETISASFKSALEQTMSKQEQERLSLTINGKPASVPPGITVTGYLASRGFHERMVVVELNGSILPKKDFSNTPLSAGDKVEIVHFVGGG